MYELTPEGIRRTETAASPAALPFQNLSDEKGSEYFAAGMQDLILTKLAEIGDLKVISSASTQRYARGQPT